VFPHQLPEVFQPRSRHVYGMLFGEFLWKLECLPNRRLQFCGHLSHVWMRLAQFGVAKKTWVRFQCWAPKMQPVVASPWAASGVGGGLARNTVDLNGPRDLFGGSHKCVHKMGPKNEPNKRVTVQIQYKSCYWDPLSGLIFELRFGPHCLKTFQTLIVLRETLWLPRRAPWRPGLVKPKCVAFWWFISSTIFSRVVRGIHHVSNKMQYDFGSFFLLGALTVLIEVPSLKTKRPSNPIKF